MVRAGNQRFYRGDEKILDYLGMVLAKRANLSHGTLLRQDGSKEYEGHFHAEFKIVMPRYNEYSRQIDYSKIGHLDYIEDFDLIYSGLGTYYFQDGSKYVGKFKKGKYDG